MLKKRINKIKTKQKPRQKQKQMQIVNVNIHKPTRRPKEGSTQPKRNVQQLPTPQYIYTSQTDSLVPQMFNKEGKQQNIPTLSEQINKALDEKVNKLVSQYSKPATQPTQQEVRQTRTETYKPNKQKMIKEYTMNKPKQEAPKVFQAEIDAPLTNIQYENPVENEPILSKQEPETISSIYKKKQPEQPEQPEENLYNIDKLVPKHWFKTYNLQHNIPKNDYDYLESEMRVYNVKGTPKSEKDRITKRLKAYFIPKTTSPTPLPERTEPNKQDKGHATRKKKKQEKDIII